MESEAEEQRRRELPAPSLPLVESPLRPSQVFDRLLFLPSASSPPLSLGSLLSGTELHSEWIETEKRWQHRHSSLSSIFLTRNLIHTVKAAAKDEYQRPLDCLVRLRPRPGVDEPTRLLLLSGQEANTLIAAFRRSLSSPSGLVFSSFHCDFLHLDLLQPESMQERLAQVALSVLNGRSIYGPPEDRTCLLQLIGLLPHNLRPQMRHYDLSSLLADPSSFDTIPTEEWEDAWETLHRSGALDKAGLLRADVQPPPLPSRLVTELFRKLAESRCFPDDAKTFVERLQSMRGTLLHYRSSTLDKLFEGTS